MEFDSDGRPVMPGWVKKEKDGAKKFILITREQISAKQPAIAQLIFEVGEELDSDKEGAHVNKEVLLNKMKNFITRAANSCPMNSVDYKVMVKGMKIILETRETKLMYSFLEWVEEEFRRTYENLYPLQKKGLYKGF